MDNPVCWPGGSPGEAAPTVDAADLKSVWNVYQRVKSQHPEKPVAVGMGIMERACSPGANVGVVAYRCTMLQMLELSGEELVTPWKKDGQLHEAIFRVAAVMPLKWIALGVPWRGLPFDVDAFFAEVQKESR